MNFKPNKTIKKNPKKHNSSGSNGLVKDLTMKGYTK